MREWMLFPKIRKKTKVFTTYFNDLVFRSLQME